MKVTGIGSINTQYSLFHQLKDRYWRFRPALGELRTVDACTEACLDGFNFNPLTLNGA